MWGHFTSILRLIEVRFNVPSLAARDASADDMMEFFDFSTPTCSARQRCRRSPPTECAISIKRSHWGSESFQQVLLFFNLGAGVPTVVFLTYELLDFVWDA